jgi:D-alanyl-D-alanine carboxypeptidase
MTVNLISEVYRSRRLAGAAALVAVLTVLPGVGQSLAAGGSAGHTAAPSPPKLSPAVQHQLQQALAQSVANPAAPGMIVGIWIPGNGTWIRATGLADRTTKHPMQVNEYMRIGSVTKTFIATLLLQLVGDGKVGLDDPVSRWAPQVPNAHHITIRELLNMSSGLYNYTEDPQFLRQLTRPPTAAVRHWTPRQLVAIALAHKPYFPPGKGWYYSNTNFILLGQIIEAVTGRSRRSCGRGSSCRWA